MKLIATSKFKKEGMVPRPGLRNNIDGRVGTIKTVTGGRTIVDFNHPLSGRDLQYTVKVSKVVSDTVEKLQAMLKIELYETQPKAKFSEGKAIVDISQEIPKEILAQFDVKVKELLPEVKSLDIKHPTNLNTSDQ